MHVNLAVLTLSVFRGVLLSAFREVFLDLATSILDGSLTSSQSVLLDGLLACVENRDACYSVTQVNSNVSDFIVVSCIPRSCF